MRISEKGKQLLIEWEGFIVQEYRDSGGAATIGCGHLLTKSEKASGKIWIDGDAIIYCNGLTVDQCMQILENDLYNPEQDLNEYVDVALTQNQFDALISFIFNVGVHAFIGSTLLKLLNQGQYEQVPAQLRRWVHDNGRVVQGLVNRREKEIKLWNGEF